MWQLFCTQVFITSVGKNRRPGGWERGDTESDTKDTHSFIYAEFLMELSVHSFKEEISDASFCLYKCCYGVDPNET